MVTWQDKFTGTEYELSEEWAGAVRLHLAGLLAEKLARIAYAGDDLRDLRSAADVCARFWREYYRLVFPLRFGKDELRGKEFPQAGATIKLTGKDAETLRGDFLDGMALPPLLTANTGDSTAVTDQLIADHHLTCAALVNVVLRARGAADDGLFHATRLGILLHELSVEEPLAERLAQFPIARQIARALCGEGEFPAGVDSALLEAIHNGRAAEIDQPVYLIGAGVQRIKQFVFESPGLNEIRGASTLLDDCVDFAAWRVDRELGPEVVLRAAAATIEFLAPAENNRAGQTWTDWLRAMFYRKTGTAFIAAADLRVKPARLLTQFDKSLRDLYEELERDRYCADLPVIEALPFEARCPFCRTRPAEGWYRDAENNPDLACRVCITKRKLGRQQRRGKSLEILRWLGVNDPRDLGVQAARRDCQAADIETLMPETARRKRVAVIYGDGNQFGQVVKDLDSLALGLQWTHRVEHTTQAALALALAHATQEAAQTAKLTKLPFQVLALGGDDLSMFTWGRLGPRVCEQFVKLTDAEFKAAQRLPPDKPRISFSLGMLVCDEKTPVRRSVEFTENGLLKWAKRATGERGMIAHLLALTPEQIPAALETYRDTMFVRERQICLTLRPFTAAELAFLLEKAWEMVNGKHSGRLQRMVEAFIKTRPRAAMLHYIYQKQRESKTSRGFIRQLEDKDTAWAARFGQLPLPAATLVGRELFGEPRELSEYKVAWFSPLWDVHELVKILE